MEINVNTRMRWESIRKNVEHLGLKNKKVLDIGAGLGYFSSKFKNMGADVTAIDVDASSLKFIKDNIQIKTKYLDIEKEELTKIRKYDLIFIGEVLEHVNNPDKLLRKASGALSKYGSVIVSTPALEGFLTNTKGKRLGHEYGSEKHERDGFFYNELERLINNVGLKILSHKYTIFTCSELFMQATKYFYLRNKNIYKGQSEILNYTKKKSYKFLKFIYPFFNLFFLFEQFISEKMKFMGHCHIIVAAKGK
jgi:2-polyprenyl-3-methyl-5-hydroxy-6-metoxy-1,4-benzoquinol methylase